MGDDNYHKNKKLIRAALEGNESDTIEALQNGADVNYHEDRYGNTALHYAAYNNHLHIISLLLSYKADLLKKDLRGRDVLNDTCSSCLSERLEIVKLLLEEGACIDSRDNFGNTPLHNAVEKNHVNIVKLLLERGADVCVGNDSKELPLHRACAKGNIEIVRLLLKTDAEKQINQQTKRGEYPLQLVPCEGDIDIVKELLSYGADINCSDNNKFTPLYFAALKCTTSAMIFFFENGADVNHVDCHGKTILEFFSYLQQSTPIEVLIAQIVKLKSQNMFVSQKNLEIVYGTRKEQAMKYEAELQLMKGEKVLNGYAWTLYDMLTEPMEDLLIILKNEKIRDVASKPICHSQLTWYKEFIRVRVDMALERAKLISECCSTVFSIMPIEIPFECTEKIVNYLDDNDMKQLIS